LRFQPENIEPATRAGLYIHVPFCVRKCPYCSFYSVADLTGVSAFVEALLMEIRLVAVTRLRFDTLYLGGGTPSLLPPQQIESVIRCAREHFCFAEAVETTIEVNPGTLSPDTVENWLAVGINRVNVGVQSFSDRNLQFLERIHSVRDASRTIEQLRKAGIDNLGIDLIYGLPGQSLENWRSDVERAVAYAPEHVSCYMLSYDAGSSFYRRYKEGNLRSPDPDRVRRLFEHTVEALTEARYDHYEISNFARKKRFRSKHNQKYWRHLPYLGLGPSAHSFIRPWRWWNRSTLADYLRSLTAGTDPVEGSEELSSSQLMLESLFLGLRTSAGIDTKRFAQLYQVDLEARLGDLLRTLRSQGLIRNGTGEIALTRKGQIFCDTVTSMFADKLDSEDGST